MGGAPQAPPATVVQVVVEVCRCGCTPQQDGSAAHPDWPLATAWAWLTRVDPGAGAPDDGPGAADAASDGPARYPWWDARAQASRRRAVLPLVLLGELQAGVLLRAVYEVVRGGGGPTA